VALRRVSILYQRGLYDSETFERHKKYGLQLMVTSDQGLLDYLGPVLRQISGFLNAGVLQKLVLVIASVETREALERWTFDIQQEAGGDMGMRPPQKDNKEIMKEIQAIIRQITASVTFLPLLDEPCSFDLLVYTNADSSTPTNWEESDPRYINNSETVKLRSFTTTVHKVGAMVSYRVED